MARPSRRSLRACVLGVLLAASPALLDSASRAAPTDTSCAALHHWAQQYRDASPSLEQLARFDRAHRIAIFNAVPATVRAGLWREQLRRFRAWPDLSGGQRAAIDDRLMQINQTIYEQAAERAATRPAWTRIAPLFPRVEQRRVWFDLGAVVSVEGVAAPSLYDRLGRPFRTATLGPTTWCECSFAYGNVECYPGGCASSPCTQKTGCGFTGTDTCSGMCSS